VLNARQDDRLISGIETLGEVVDANLGKHSWKAWVENCPRANYNKGFGVFKATAKYQSDEGLKRASTSSIVFTLLSSNEDQLLINI
jgi:hypothetical protein